jgi:pimeloyl-ACP methyl ester carboxylesterase
MEATKSDRQAPCREVRLRDGRILAYAQYGSPSGHAVVYCHGVPSSRVEGDLIINSSLASALGLRVIVPDRPGMGRSTYQHKRWITGWPDDVAEFASLLGLDRYSVLGSSGGGPYALACGIRYPQRVRAVGLLGSVAPADAPGMMQAMSGPLRLMFRLARFAPAMLRTVYRLNLRAVARGGERAGQRMAQWAPEPDRVLLQRPEIRDGFTACFVEACRQGPAGAALDVRLIAQPWGIDLSAMRVPTFLWHGELDRNVPVVAGRYLASAIPNCRATFYPQEAHLSLPFNHQEEILRALATA